ncbi:protocatechuate 3,4-dioxygenase [Photobacterium sanctipauli]|uniref:Protocatechuate 3,4-dioxygenase n=1 Tax=Photobacterium sanctipauli TaxID=1342794 RepID=A0A2T3NWZ9_9GAMM|nr:protocatechuate 3,4-dioxygenase [Photobacterium sanctipauli]PSW20761.1 protocatechuate 3,4-dioxygenase [Photobacterium sanctipauli]
MKRRRFIELFSLAFIFPSWASGRKPLTPKDAEGPFYPVEVIPLREDLILKENGLNGSPMVLSGRVFDQQGQPLANMKIEIWQCDGAGIYHHPRQANTEKHDSHFAGNGAVVTDEQGRYQFRTLYPVPYTGRPPHIHVKLWRGHSELLTTQLYLKGQTGNEWWGKNRDLLQMSPQKSASGQYSAIYDFVV